MIQKILLATDGSAAAGRAVEYAASLSRRYHAKLLVLHAYTPGPSGDGSSRRRGDLYKSQAEATVLVDETRGRLKELGAEDVESDVMEGPAAHVILGVAESRSLDLIVLGARGSSTWQGSMLGSTSLAVTQRAACPVLVVK